MSPKKLRSFSLLITRRIRTHQECDSFVLCQISGGGEMKEKEEEEEEEEGQGGMENMV